jgi:hypothetical protein
MNRNITIGLNSKEIDDLIKKLDNWADMMDKASKNIVKDLSDYSLEQMQKVYNENNFKSSEATEFGIVGSEYEKKVFMQGAQAIYNEFGTGTEGEKRPHPMKDEFGLNPYNSGKTIRKAKGDIAGITEGELYWTYKDSNGETVYTQGIPAQKEVYEALKATTKKMPSIIKKRMEETLK